MSKKTATVILRIEPELKEQLRLVATHKGRTMAGFVAQLIREYIGKNPETLQPPPNIAVKGGE